MHKPDTFASSKDGGNIIYKIKVELYDGPIPESFIKKCKEAPYRVIELRGSHTLQDLHDMIFKAFNRFEQHQYEFQFGGENPMDEKAVCYGLKMLLEGFDDGHEIKDAETTPMIAVDLKVGDTFFYWFDFGDNWMHKCELLSIEESKKDKQRYPKIVERSGPSPAQYYDDID